MAKLKTCSFCNSEVPKLWYSKPACCANYSCKQKYNEEKKKSGSSPGKGNLKPAFNSKTFRNSTIKPKPRKTTGEYALFLQIYAERKGICEVTGQQIPFDVKNMAHILSKAAYPAFRLNPENIIHVHPDVHNWYDNSNKESLLSRYPEAIIIYERKEKLKSQYYQK